jgi:predicted Zn-dependent protease
VITCLFLAALPVRASTSFTAEQKLGTTFDMEARKGLPLSEDADINGYVERLGKKIVAALGSQPFSYHFAVVRDPRINAFAVPGGYVYIHIGLLAAASTDDEVAGVLAHEIAHVNAHHLVRQQEATQLLNYATLLGLLLSVVHPAVGAGAATINSAVQLQYRREFEQEADYLGATYMRQAGYDPGGMLDFFKKMLDEQRLAPAAPPPYLLSHPLTDTRLTNLEAVLHRHQWEQRSRPPTSFELARVQLLVRIQTGAPANLVESYWKQAAARPDDGRARYLLGLAYFETGAYDAAREAFEKVPRSGDADPSRELGRTWLRLNQPEKARELLRRAAEVNPDDPLAHHELARAYEALNDSDGATREYERELQLAPGLEEAHYNLGMLAGRAGRLGEGFYHLAVALKLRGDYDKALSQFKKAEPLFPAGSERAQTIHTEIAEIDQYLKHGRLW